MNMNGEFPLSERISIRLHASEKKKAKDLSQTYREIFLYGLKALAKEEIRLKYEIGELEVVLAKQESDANGTKALLAAKKNRLRMIAPSELDEDTLQGMLVESAGECAESIFRTHGVDSIIKIESSLAKSSIRSEGRDLGYDEDCFFVEVKNQLEDMCHTVVSDSSFDKDDLSDNEV